MKRARLIRAILATLVTRATLAIRMEPVRKSMVVLMTSAMFLVGSFVAFGASHEEAEANPCNPCNPEGGDGNY
jgi:hypothetical protein